MKRPQKITLGEIREMGIRGLLVYCSDFECNVEINADQWSDDVRLSDLEPLFTCQACGQGRRSQSGFQLGQQAKQTPPGVNPAGLGCERHPSVPCGPHIL
jgi:hypothetical protein